MTLDKVKLKTINNQSVIGDGNITVGGSSVDIVTSWSSTTSDSKVPSEKLTKNSLDDKIAKSSTSGLVKNDGSIDTTSYLSTNDIGSSSSTSSSKIVACNDSRLSDSRTPTSHTHTSNQVTDLINTIYPVGSIYMSVNSTNPSTLFGGTWEQIAQGRTLIGQGTGTDSNNIPKTFNNGETGGEYEHTLTQKELLGTIGLINNASTQYYGAVLTSNSGWKYNANYELNADTGWSHNNIQPYFVCYIWKRTA